MNLCICKYYLEEKNIKNSLYHKNGNYVYHDQVEAEELELINFRSSWSKPWSKPWSKARLKPWVEVLEAFTDVTKLDETFGLVESVLWRHNILLLSHDL